MNKKIIAIAIASALTAPVAMADMTISGAFYGELINANDVATAQAGIGEVPGDAATTFADGGKNTVAFTATSGNVYGKLGLDVGPGAGQTAGGAGTLKYRDFYIGYKLDGGASIQFGTMSGAIKNLEKDAYIATFLQTRGTYAEASTSSKPYGSKGYVANVIQYKGKVGGGTLIAQYNPTSDTNVNDDEGHMGISYAAKSGGVDWYVGYNNGAGGDAAATDDTNMKLGARMKFGTVKANLDYSSADNGTTDWTSISIGATFDLGNGMSANVNYGMMDTPADPTSIRVAVTKSLAKNASLYAGYTSHDNGTASADIIGFGMGVKF